VSHLETYKFLEDALFHMKNLLQIKDMEIKFIACDAHPAFITRKLGKKLANQFNVPLYSVQHHYAHILGVMAENGVQPDEKIIGISTDGVGYGDDGNIWGGEILLSTYNGYKRIGHLEYQPMIGGDRCTKFPARMLASILLKEFGIEKASKIFSNLKLQNDLEYKKTELNTIISQFEMANNKFPSENIPLTSSTGRILDTVSYLLGACKIKTYRGEPAMRLEALATKGIPNKVNLKIEIDKKNGIAIINTSKALIDIINLLKTNRNKPSDIAAKFQIELALAFAEIAKENAELRGIEMIGLTGGVAYNYSISQAIREEISQEGFHFFEHNLIAPGDAGVSTGQLIGGLFQHRKNT
jgi:hydrogenase maturation protein HypF